MLVSTRVSNDEDLNRESLRPVEDAPGGCALGVLKGSSSRHQARAGEARLFGSQSGGAAGKSDR
jgi:hypothetical protein